jgi:hypothetical protein
MTAPAVVTMTRWRLVPHERKQLLRVLDPFGMTLELLSDCASLYGLPDFRLLASVVLPAGLRVLPRGLFFGCG